MRSTLNMLDQAVAGQQLTKLHNAGICCALKPDDVTSEHNRVRERHQLIQKVEDDPRQSART